MTKKQAVKAIVFFIILAAVITRLVFLFEADGSNAASTANFNQFYQEPRNTLDAVYIGASGVHRFWLPPLAWNEYGMTVFNLSAPAQSIVLVKYVIEDALKYQSPSLLIIDLRAVTGTPNDPFMERNLRTTLDAMRHSFTRYKAVKASLDYQESDEINVPALYLPFLLYHGKWNGALGEYHFRPRLSIGKGYDLEDIYVDFNIEPTDHPVFIESKTPVHTKTGQVLHDLLDYCQDLPMDVLFVAAPASYPQQHYEAINYAAEMVESRGFTMINFNHEEVFQQTALDFNTDFFDSAHVNLQGAIKYTAWLAQHLHTTYDLPDRRGETGYSSWEEAYRYLTDQAADYWLEEWDAAYKP